MKGVHFVRSRGAYGTRWHIYAWRGGPKIDTVDCEDKPALTIRQQQLVSEAIDEALAPKGTIGELVGQWERSREWKALAQSTQQTWGVWTKRIAGRWRDIEHRHFSDPRIVPAIVRWRDQNADNHGLRAADIGVTVLKQFLEWARLRGDVTINGAAGVPTLYKGANRAEIIWLPEDIEAFTAKANQDEIDILTLASWTGFRRADLHAVKPTEVGKDAIVRKALKRSKGRRRRAVVPILRGFRPTLESWMERPTLLTKNGKPWSKADSMGKAFHRIRDLAGVVHIDEDGAERPKNLHDLRGTFVTKLCRAGLTDDEIASIVAWSPQNVAEIRKTYVDDAAVVVAISRRIEAAL